MLKIFSSVYVAVLLIGGGLRFLPIFPSSKILWVLQLIVSELGLLLAVPLLFMSLRLWRRPQKFRAPAVLAPVALVLCLLPVLETIGQERNWIWDLEYGAGRDQKPDREISPYVGTLRRPLFHFKDFFKFPGLPTARDEYYTAADGSKHAVFIYSPEGDELSAVAKPWIMSIHGGGWSSGYPTDLSQTVPALLAKGFIVVAPKYRFAPTYTWPTQQSDLEHAYRFVIANAARLKVDPAQLWLMGRSAGGQLALKLAYGSSVVQNVRGVIALYAPTDLDFGYRWSLDDDVLNSKKMLREFVGATPDENPGKYRAASPLYDVTPTSPPTLIITGRADPLVWYRHAYRLADRLKENRVRVTHLELPWATHGFDYFPNSPGGQVSTNSILRFLEAP